MLKGAVGKVMWVGRATVFAVGLAVILALAFATASMVFGVNGGRTLPGDYDHINPITQLVGSDGGANQVLSVDPMAMRRQIEVPRGYAQVNVSPTAVTTSGAKGINGVVRHPTQTGVYCFDLSFAPKTALASPFLTNNATIGTALGSAVPSGCPASHREAAAKTHAGNTSEALNDINFNIVFI
jgi:hypothetical protein